MPIPNHDLTNLKELVRLTELSLLSLLRRQRDLDFSVETLTKITDNIARLAATRKTLAQIDLAIDAAFPYPSLGPPCPPDAAPPTPPNGGSGIFADTMAEVKQIAASTAELTGQPIPFDPTRASSEPSLSEPSPSPAPSPDPPEAQPAQPLPRLAPLAIKSSPSHAPERKLPAPSVDSSGFSIPRVRPFSIRGIPVKRLVGVIVKLHRDVTDLIEAILNATDPFALLDYFERLTQIRLRQLKIPPLLIPPDPSPP